ncbi:zinc metallopeptidase [Aestuariispira insulae]|uniref:Zinc metallopeptidase n=1 Tax=Aestuariispira insulae TaxID=1461337 RepID=A0A3D9HPG1_9PROT|nr:zinc metallopeptidase [Aestuariispira insulae]RED51394.1 hypothetical protein DFP90_103194 [Aestuariispira insulae]
MPFLGLFLIILFAAVIFGPGLWTKRVLARHNADRPDYPGTGGELARHLLDGYKLSHIPVEVTDQGDHYDPINKAVRLSKDYYHGRSLTAIAVAAHEVSHAIQDRDGYKPLARRTQLVKSVRIWQQIGNVMIVVASIGSLFIAGPLAFVIGLFGFLLTGLLGVIVHLSTLPVEIDASFNRALPILEHGGYLPKDDLPAAREILKACAYTYVAAALGSILNLLRLLRR